MQDSAEPAGSTLTRCQRGDVVVRPTPAAPLTPPGLADSGTSAAGAWSALPARACVPMCPCQPEPVSPCAPEVPWRVTPFCLLRKPHFNGDTASARSSATVKHADDSSRVNAEPKLPKTVFSQS